MFHKNPEMQKCRIDYLHFCTSVICILASKLLRRIAVARIGREEAAGLTGEEWLEWLEQQDPEEFPWTREGKALITVPYAPPGHCPVSREQVERLIEAALVWARRQRS